MKKRIKINPTGNITNLICSLFIGIIIVFFIYHFTQNITSLLFWLTVIVIGGYFSYKIDIKTQEQAVTIIDMTHDDYLILHYKNGQNIKIIKNEIKSFNVILDCNEDLSYYKFITTSTKGNIHIELYNGKDIDIELYEQVSIGNYKCHYELILFVINNTNAIPKFSYKINGNSQLIKNDIEYYSIYKKRLPRNAIYKYELENASFQRKFTIIMIPILCILGVLSLLIAIIFTMQ